MNVINIILMAIFLAVPLAVQAAKFSLQSRAGVASGSMGDGESIPMRSMLHIPAAVSAGMTKGRWAYLLNLEYSTVQQQKKPSGIQNQNLSGKSQTLGIELQYFIKSWTLGIQYRPEIEFRADAPSVANETVVYTGSSGYSFIISKRLKKNYGAYFEFANDSFSQVGSLSLEPKVMSSRLGVGVIYIFNWSKLN